MARCHRPLTSLLNLSNLSACVRAFRPAPRSTLLAYLRHLVGSGCTILSASLSGCAAACSGRGLRRRSASTSPANISISAPCPIRSNRDRRPRDLGASPANPAARRYMVQGRKPDAAAGRRRRTSGHLARCLRLFPSRRLGRLNSPAACRGLARLALRFALRRAE